MQQRIEERGEVAEQEMSLTPQDCADKRKEGYSRFC